MSSQKKSFLTKLREMVNSDEGIRWNATGLVIEVFDENLLQQAILKNFRTNKQSTFHRQLTYYQFYTFIHPDGHRLYKNKNFIRDNMYSQNIIRNQKKVPSGLVEDDLNHLFRENKKQMIQLKEIQKKQLYIISNLQIQTKIHIQLSNTLQNIALHLNTKPDIEGGERFSVQFQQFISGLRPDYSSEVIKEIFGTDLLSFSPIPFYFR